MPPANPPKKLLNKIIGHFTMFLDYVSVPDCNIAMGIATTPPPAISATMKSAVVNQLKPLALPYIVPLSLIFAVTSNPSLTSFDISTMFKYYI